MNLTAATNNELKHAYEMALVKLHSSFMPDNNLDTKKCEMELEPFVREIDARVKMGSWFDFVAPEENR